MDDLTLVLGSFAVFIAILIGVPVYYAVKRARFREEAQYALSANAVVIGERTNISGNQAGTSTYYYVTFDIEGIGRAEFNVAGSVSGLLVEGDRGTLRYLTDPFRFVDFSLTQRSQFQQ